jgi:hypothetical protein
MKATKKELWFAKVIRTKQAGIKRNLARIREINSNADAEILRIESRIKTNQFLIDAIRRKNKR